LSSKASVQIAHSDPFFEISVGRFRKKFADVGGRSTLLFDFQLIFYFKV